MTRTKKTEKPMPAKRYSKTVETRIELELHHDILLKALQCWNPEIPEDATISYRLPSGEYFGGEEIHVDSDSPLTVQWTMRDSEEKVEPL